MQQRRRRRVQAIWAQQNAGWGAAGQAGAQQGYRRAGGRARCNRAQARVQQGAGSGAAGRRLGCSKAQARAQQGVGPGAGAGAASKGAQQGLIAFDGCWLKGRFGGSERKR
ncbi:hypothetical protein SLEP1_g38563 [Rubroshorea leprosula]|nr:hypothetical protein SLEP1_g38563 [Rubroshorea leprosula]